ncbi:MAG: glycoside hydrolase family 99-like domain-containing protein [Bacteroidales bacterium]|nr:glycoside hydrolase family 99-like domain-containing protein [Bacteroidales bacterium]
MISVAISTYNGEQYIEEQLYSILNQSQKVNEIVVCDDGSTDRTVEIIRNISETNNDVIIRICINEHNLGVCANFEKAIYLCKGDIIFLSDQDDVWNPNKVETIMKWFDKNPDKSVVFTDATLIDSFGGKISDKTLWDYVKFANHKLFDKGFQLESFRYNKATGATMALRKDFRIKFSKYAKKNIYHDYILALYAIGYDKLGYISETLIKYRISNLQSVGLNFSTQSINYKNVLCPSLSYKYLYDLNIPSLPKIRKRLLFNAQRESFSGRFVLKHFIDYILIYGIQGFRFFLYDLKTAINIRVKTRQKKNSVISKKDFAKYADWVDFLKKDKSQFVNFTCIPYKRELDDVKIFTFYLPQFHAIPENDMAYGKGFTEWNSVVSCMPQFVGHYQPKVPYDLGFYDLTKPGVMERQVEIAKAYGIYGFCFYYYWFSGKKLLEKPLNYFLNSKIEFHYHFCWANENWSKLWDGGNSEIIVKQPTENIDASIFFKDILPFFSDSRYEKINGKPILTIYKPLLFEKEIFEKFIRELNELACASGFPGIYFLGTNVAGFDEPKEYCLDGIMEFPPHNMDVKEMPIKRLIKTTNFSVYNMDEYISNEKYNRYWGDGDLYKSCFPSWDNLPRKMYSHGKCFLLSDEAFEQWLDGIIKWTKRNNSMDKQYVYINAWNEWGEGAMLEPTTRFGYKYLDIVKKCIEKFRMK